MITSIWIILRLIFNNLFRSIDSIIMWAHIFYGQLTNLLFYGYIQQYDLVFRDIELVIIKLHLITIWFIVKVNLDLFVYIQIAKIVPYSAATLLRLRLIFYIPDNFFRIIVLVALKERVFDFIGRDLV